MHYMNRYQSTQIITRQKLTSENKEEWPWHWILLSKARNPFSTRQPKQGQQLNQIQAQKLIMELTVETRKQKHKLAFKDISSRYITLEFPCHTFFRTIGRGSCSAKFGSLRKKVSFSTLSFKFRISIKCIVSTSLFWKYSANPLVEKLYNKRKKNGREKKIQEATLCQKQKSRAEYKNS